MDFDFNGDNPLSNPQILLLLSFTNLQVLHITESWTLDCLLVVFENYDEIHKITPLPALRLLSFESIHFANRWVNSRFDNLLYFLRRRSLAKFPISTIKFRGCSGFVKQDLESLGISIEI